MSNDRILFMGTPEFAVASLNALVDAGFSIAAVVTAPDRPAGRGRQLRMSAVKELALELGLPVLQPERMRDPTFLAELDHIDASLYVVVAFRMLPEVVWTKPRLGTINLHGSLLPQYRGAAPINWAVINGEATTGATTFFIKQEIDTGDMIDRVELPIGPDDNAGVVHDKLMAGGARLLARTVHSILTGSVQRKPQVEIAPTAIKHAPKLTPENCRIDWKKGAQRVHDHIRGLSPYPGAWTQCITVNGALHFKILRARIASEGASTTIGAVQIERERLFVRCASGSIEVLELQPEGKRRMATADFLRGAGSIGSFHFE